MTSAEKETVPFKHVISTKSANGKVEEWLLRVEEVMFASIHDVTQKASRYSFLSSLLLFEMLTASST
jgi:hypothetical protein